MIEKLKTKIVAFFELKRIVIAAALAALALAAVSHFKQAEPPRPQTQLVPTLQYLTAADLNDIKAQMRYLNGENDKLRAGQIQLSAVINARLEKLEAWQAKASAITTGTTSKAKR